MRKILLTILVAIGASVQAAIVPVGSGSYTTTFPGCDAAGRNAYPGGTPQISGKAASKPVPTNDWWSSLLNQNHVSNLFNYPFTLKTVNSGLVVSYIPQGVIDDLLPVTVGVQGLSAEQCTVSDYSDWTVTMRWNDGMHQLEATAGIGMPFLYFTKNTADVVQITITSGTATVRGEQLIIENAKHGADFAIYAPAGSTWTNLSGVYTSQLNGKNYWSLAFLPPSADNLEAVADEYQQYAYVFPVNTKASFSYNEQTSVVRTDFIAETEVKEGTDTCLLMGLLPHQWAHLASNSAQPQSYSYNSIRGELKMLAGNAFSVENVFHGILPTLPYADTLSATFSRQTLCGKLNAMQNDEIGTWTDSYNDGQLLNRLVQSARVAAEVGDSAAFNAMLTTIRTRLENWLKADNGEVAFLFYYCQPWTTMLGYPAGHGQDSNLNDHHFHWAYLIHAAAFVEQYCPGWAAQWGGMVDLLVRDAASTNRTDTMFPYLRNFSPYAGHCWANGFATFPNGNDQESTSESMQFNSALIHWGAITGNSAIRDLGIYLYTTEQTAIEEYWFDVHQRNFPSTQQYALVSRLWGNNFDNQTFWTGDIAASYGIELYPVHGGSFYLAQDAAYARRLWAEIKQNTGIVRNEANDNLWHDVMWQFASMTNPSEALQMYESYPTRSLKFGVSDAQTYHWVHAMQAIGTPLMQLTANWPLAMAFDRNGRRTYVAQNYTNASVQVQFSDGFAMNVPPRQLHWEQAGKALPQVSLVSPQNNSKHTPGSTVNVEATAADYAGSVITQVEFYADGSLFGTDTQAPYTANFTAGAGTYKLTAKVYNALGDSNVSDTLVLVFADETSCSETSAEALQGTFSVGYRTTFETIGTNVHLAFTLLDTDKSDLMAYLWQEMPFTEYAMTRADGQTFDITLTGQTVGTELRIACKFAYAGGMSVTKYFSYVVGENCGSTDVRTNDAPRAELSPNPVEDLLRVSSPEPVSSIEICTLLGQNVRTAMFTGTDATLSVGDLPAGHYLLRLHLARGGCQTLPLLKK